MKKTIGMLLLSVAIILTACISVSVMPFAAESVVSLSEETSEVFSDEQVPAVFEYIFVSKTQISITSVNKDVTGELIIPEYIDGYKVYSVEDKAFANCEGITSVVIDAVLSDSSGSSAFANCTSLKSVTFTKKLNRICSYWFKGCTALENVQLHDGLEFISYSAFSGCTSLKFIEIPETVEAIYNNAFADCTALESIYIPSSVKMISGHVFENCTALSSVILSEGLEEISNNAFLNCTSLTTVDLPASLTSLSATAFIGCTNLTAVNTSDSENAGYISDGAAVISADKTEIVYYSPVATNESYMVPDGIEVIPANIFTVNSSLKHLELPDSVTTISQQAFYKSSIESIVLGENVANVGKRAFADSKLKTVKIESVMDNWSTEVFYGCKNLDTVTIGSKTTSIPGETFAYSTVKNVYDGANITSVQNSAFRGCSYLETVEFGENVLIIGSTGFMDCLQLKTIPFGSNIESIDGMAFYNCAALEGKLEFPDCLTSIGNAAFSGCSSITGVSFGNGLSALPSSLFAYCDGLEEIIIPGNIKSIAANCFSSSYPSSVVLCEGVEIVGNSAFAGNASDSRNHLSSIELPSTLKTIGDHAFSNHKTTKIVIPKNVESIGGSAFQGAIDFDAYIYSYSCIYDSTDCPFNVNSGISEVTVYAYSGSTTQTYIENCPDFSGAAHAHVLMDLCEEVGHTPITECVFETVCKYCNTVISGHTDADIDERCDICGKSTTEQDYVPDCTISFDDGILTVSGNKIVEGDYVELLSEYADSTTAIVFEEGFTSVGDNIFTAFNALRIVYIPSTITHIGASFVDCISLTNIVCVAESAIFDKNALSGSGECNLFIKQGSDISAPENANMIRYEFNDTVMSFSGVLESDLYDLFDLTTMFAMLYDDIMTLNFEEFHAVGFSVYAFNTKDYTEINKTDFENVDFTIHAFKNGEYTQISFNELYSMAADGYDGLFYLTTTTDEDDVVHDDTQISIADQFRDVINRILSAIVNLLNKLFAFFSKLF